MNERSPYTVLALLSLAGASTVGGCVVTDVHDFEAPPGVTASGSCMCAVCWDRPFCFDMASGVSTARGAGDPCPAGRMASEPTSRVLLADDRRDLFHCVRPRPDVDLGFEDALCPPNEEPARATIEAVEPCIDVPLCRRIGPSFAGCPELPGPTDPLCPSIFAGARRVVCSPTDGDIDLGHGRAREKLVDACAIYGSLDIPSGAQAERFCFLNCVDHLDACALVDGTSPSTCDGNCDPVLFDPPEITHGSILLPIEPPSHALVTVRIERRILDDIVTRGEVGVEGLVALEAPGCGPGQSCSATIRFLEVHSIEPLHLDAGRREATLTDIVVRNVGPMEDDLVPDASSPATTSMLTIPGGETVYASAEISGEPNRQGAPLALSSAITGHIEWDSRTFMIHAMVGDPDPRQTSVELVLQGSVPNLLPVADAGPDRVVECDGAGGAIVSLSGAASMDPDGLDDLVSFVWVTGEGPREVAEGVESSVRLPPGESRLALVVADRFGAQDVDGVTIDVVDTEPPSFVDVALATDCLWSPDHRMNLLRLGEEIRPTVEDGCDGTVPDVRIVDAFSNQPDDGLGDGHTTPDVRFGSGAVCLRSERAGGRPEGRGYTIVLEARDRSGNVGRREVVVEVPHDQRPAHRCVTGDLAPAVADEDPRCEAAVVAPALAPPPEAGPAPATPGAAGCGAAPGSHGATTGPGWLVFLGVLYVYRRRR